MSVPFSAVADIEWQRVPDRVEPGEPFDMVVRVFADESETTGQPITFLLDGEEFYTTTGADIDAGGFAFDGQVGAVIEEPGTYRLEAEVDDLRTEPHFIGVGQEPAPSPRAGGLGSLPPGTGKAVAAVAALAVGRKLFGGGD